MASITLSPAGTQLDNDEITDLQVEPGDRFNASFELDTSGFEANLQTLIVQGSQDFTEVDFTAMRTVFDSTTFPDLNIVEISTNDNFTSIVFEATGPGAVPDTTNVLIEGEITALESLNNDGQPDFGINVVRAIDANGNDVTDLFESTNQTVDLQPSPPVQKILGTENSEPIIGTPQDDSIKGKAGNDLIISNEGNDESFGDEGNDLFFDGAAGNDTVRGGAGDDLLNGGDDEAFLGDFLSGDEGADTLLGEGGNDVLNGDNGNDILVGGSGIDVINGGYGDDLLVGGAGNDLLVGNEGSDTFAFTSGEGADIVFDFEPGQDAIAKLTEGIALTSGSSYDSLHIEYNAQGNYTNISEETGELIATLIGVEANHLTESNFTTI